MATEVERRPTAPVPAGNTTSPRRAGQAVAPRTTGRNLPANLSVFSILDLIGQEMVSATWVPALNCCVPPATDPTATVPPALGRGRAVPQPPVRSRRD
jgi:hypothetical protein